MAIVTFWNDNTGKIGQTYSAISIASYMAVEHNYKILLLSTKYDDDTIMKAFGIKEVRKSIDLITGKSTSMDLESGIEGMAKLVSANRLNPDMVQNYSKIIYKNRLEAVGAPKRKEGLDYAKLYQSCSEIISIADKYYDIVIVDLNNGINNATTQEILKKSNIVILNIEQKYDELQKIHDLKQNKELFAPKKILTLMNNYDRKSKYTSKNVTRELSEKKEILTVPYCNLFSDAVQEGDVAEFFLNATLKKLEDMEDRTAFFIKEVARSTEAIIYRMQELQMRI